MYHGSLNNAAMMRSLDDYSLDSIAGELSHGRSSSQGPSRLRPDTKSVPKVRSVNALSSMALQSSPLRSSRLSNESDESLNTFPDPNASSSDRSRTRSPSPRAPGLSEEMESLSNKLIRAINSQTALEDTLSQVRHELERSKTLVGLLESEAAAGKEKIASGLLLSREQVEVEKEKLVSDSESARKEKDDAVEAKICMEREVEQLSASLFEEANKLVADANKERHEIERKNQMLRDQVKDTETLLANQQEQLTQLKAVMQQMGSEDKDDAHSARNSTGPSSPTSFKEKDQNLVRLLGAMNLSPASIQSGGDISPAPSMTFTHLLKPVCRTDLPAFEDFRHLVHSAQPSQPHTRVASGASAGLSVAGLGSLNSASSVTNSSTTSLSGSTAPNVSAQTTPHIPGSFSPRPSLNATHLPPLKDLKFYKRLLLEDIEPTLRLDLSPSINWLGKRSVLSSLSDNTLAVEPIPERFIRLYGRYSACGLCGEARHDAANPRTHRMRASEGESAPTWLLCVLCLDKVRGACDLVSYLRLLRDGVVRCTDAADEAEAWEELVRLRERLFWARMAGGVVPAFVERNSSNPPSGKPSLESPREALQRSESATSTSSTSSSAAARAAQLNSTPTSEIDPAPTKHRHTQSSPHITTTRASNKSLFANAQGPKAEAEAAVDPDALPIRDITPTTPPSFPAATTGQAKAGADARGRGGSWAGLRVSMPRAWTGFRDEVNVLR